MKENLLRITAFLAVCAAGFVSAGLAVGSGGPPQMVTICHAAGQAGTTKFVTLTLPYNAVYGQAGHFNEPGTTAAGHEQDYEGACRGDETETDPTETDPTETDPTVTDPTETDPTVTETETTPERCPPPNPDGSYGGKDGKPGNDECVADPVPSVTTTPEPPVTTTPEPPVVCPAVEPPAVKQPKPDKAPKVVSVKPGKNPGTVIITTSDGKTHVGVQGSG